MAITGAALQAALGSGENDARVVGEFGVSGTKQNWYIEGKMDVRFGRSGFVETTASDNAATQAAAVITALNAY